MIAELAEVEVEEDEELTRYYESCHWVDLIEGLRHLLCELDDNRSLYRKTIDEDTSEYDKAEAMLYEVERYMRGRAHELNPDYYGDYYTSEYDKELKSYARQEGINYIALEEIYSRPHRREVIEYLMESGQASMKYEATLKAVKDYDDLKYRVERVRDYERKNNRIPA